MKKKWIISGIVLLLIIVSSLFLLRNLFYNGYIRLNYPSFAEYPVQGIDISHHQGYIDWANLDKQQVQFAFIKATEGGNHKDSLYQHNWEEARRNGILVGAYHFFTFCKDGDSQARNYIHYVPKESINLPPAIDLEYGGNCKKENRKEDLIHEIQKFLDITEDYYQQKVIIYTTNEFYKDYMIDQFPDNPIWIRNIISTPKLPDGRKWQFWQFANRGRIDGIEGDVDLNVFVSNTDEFSKLLENIEQQ